MSDSEWEEVGGDEWEEVKLPTAPRQAPKAQKKGDWIDYFNGLGSSVVQGIPFADEFDAGVSGIGSLLGGRGFSAGYNERLGAARQEYKDFAKENPGTGATAEVVGSLPLMFLPGGQAKTLAGMVKAGAGYGALAGAGKGEGGEDRLAKALVGGGAGGVSAGALKAASSALTPALQWLARPGIADEAGAILPKAAETISPAEAKLLKRLSSVSTDDLAAMNDDMARALVEGTPLFLGDAGSDVGAPALRSQAKWLTQHKGSSKEALEALKARAEGAPDRITNILDDISPERDIYKGGQSLIDATKKQIDALTGARDKASSPIYKDTFRAIPEVPAEDVRRLAEYNKPLRQAIDSAQSMGEGAYLPDNSTLVLHEAKQSLDDMIANALGKGKTNEARKLGELKDEVVSLLDSSTGGRYKTARNLYEFKSRPINEIQEGPLGGLGLANPDNVGSIFDKMSPTTLRQAMRQLPSAGPVRDAYRSGMQADVLNKHDTSNIAKALIGKPMQRDMLTELMGPTEANELLRKLQLENRIATLSREYGHQSGTATNLAEKADFEAGNANLGGLIDALKSPLRTVSDLIQNGLYEPNDELARALAGIHFDTKAGAAALQKLTPYAIQRNKIASDVDMLSAFASAPLRAAGLSWLTKTPE